MFELFLKGLEIAIDAVAIIETVDAIITKLEDLE